LKKAGGPGESRTPDQRFRKTDFCVDAFARFRFAHNSCHHGYPCNSTDIGIGDTRELLLMCALDDRLVTLEDRRTDNRDFYEEPFSWLQDYAVDGYESVEITFIDQNTQASLVVKLRVWRNGANFCSTVIA
jgi:hypothetical protein